jgi:hypothetical protein
MLLKLGRQTNPPHSKMACVDNNLPNHAETPAQFLYNNINDYADTS